LAVTITHVDPAPKCHAIDGAPPVFTLNFKDPPTPGNPGAFVPPLVGANLIKAAAEQKNHPAGAQTHSDLVKVTVTVPPLPAAANPATIHTQGVHRDAPLPFTASVTGPAGNVVITPDFRSANGSLTDGTPINVGNVAAGVTRDVRLPLSKVGTGEPLTSYKVVASGSGTTDTHLAFVGLVDGVLSELDLGVATAAFAGGEFVVPMLRHETLDLFVFVDLTQWTSVLPSFAIGDEFDFVGGVSAELPGFLASTTPIAFVAGVGPTTAAPLTAEVFVGAQIDGHVPEPGTLALFVPAALLLVRAVRRQARRRA
jgi:hypothetical protein